MSIKLKKIKDQVIVITGASSGIGLETAKLAAEMGAKVVLASRNGKELQKIVNKLKAKGGDALAVETNVQSFKAVQNLADQTIAKYGRIDTWVNNAGHSVFGPLLEIPEEEERAIFETNFWGVRHGCRVAVPLLSEKGGALINIGSEVSAVSVPIQGMYSATKHAVKAYTDALRVELEHKNIPISVTLVRPAAINTPFAKHASNHLEKGAPSLPPPVYDVENVARAILKCAETPHRDAYIGSASRIFDVASTLFPKITDRLLKGMIDRQAKGDPEDHPKSKESVLSAPLREGKTRAPQKEKVRKTSYYTKLTPGQKKSRRSKEHARTH
jgi:short-subunit dehydrogenase